MLDKIIGQIRLHALAKKTCIFFTAFAVTLTLMGGIFGFDTGDGVLSGVAYAAGQASETEDVTTKQATQETVKTNKSKAETAAEADKTKTESEAATPEKSKVKTESGEADAEKSKAKAESEAAPAEESKGQTESGEATEKEAVTTKTAKKKKDDAAKTDGFVYRDSIPMSYELQEYTYQKCVERGLEYELVLAIIWRESRFKVDAVNVNTNGTRDNGIMQINDVNRKWLYERHGIQDLMNPYQNIDAGTAMLGSLTQKYGAHKAMMAYQYGEGGMAKRLKQGQTTSAAIEAAYRQRDYYKQMFV